MSDLEELQNENRELQQDLRDSLELIRSLDTQLDELSAARAEPIAIISVACRLPGDIDDPEAYWRLLSEGRDAVGPFPERWSGLELYDPDPEAAGKSYAREGGFLRTTDAFDAPFFAIARREAQGMDPQQRIVLETTWEALERGGLVPERLCESATGVFLGAAASDYRVDGAGLASCDGYLATGTCSSVLSGRISYILGLQGPAMTVDTACSSSLVALHLACSALRQRECDLALAGGVTVMNTPGIFIEFSRLRGLSPSGRCKSFSADADGATWAEACGVMVLKRLSDAQRDGDRILAVVRGTAVNQDGRSQGLTAPNGPAQQRVIHEALAAARLTPADIDAIEAHGTGTPLGDPIEAGALAEVFGPARDAHHPVYLGSSKSNLGHAQAAAGIIGAIKVVLSLQHELLPKTLHAARPSPEIDWPSSGLSLLQEARPWPRGERVRRAGVSSFGFSGTNAHAIFEEAPSREAEQAQLALEQVPVLLSGRDERALQTQAARWADQLSGDPSLDPVDVAHTAAVLRTHFDERAALLVPDREALITGLRALANGASDARLVRGRVRAPGKLAVLFTGQGSQRAEMGKALYEAQPVFRAALEEVAQALDAHLAQPLLGLMFAPPGSELAALLDQTEYTQPALFAHEVALFRQWQAWGIAPTHVAGHSIGELTAAHVAGVLDLHDAARLVCTRARLMQACERGGAMLSVEASEPEVRAALANVEGRIDIAGLNSARQTVVSGDADAVQRLEQLFSADGRRARRLSVSHAFHSAHMEGSLRGLEEAAQRCTFHEPKLRLVSLLTGELASLRELAQPSYWARQVREPVRFAQGIATLQAEGIATYLECGPDGVLSALAAASLDPASEACLVASQRKGQSELDALLRAYAQLHVAGLPLEHAALFGARRPLVELPTYPFQRERYWLTTPVQRADAPALGLEGLAHPLLGAAAELALDGTQLFTGRAPEGVSFDPLELALFAARCVGGLALAELTVDEKAHAPARECQRLQVSLAAADPRGARSLTVWTRAEHEGAAWQLHARGALVPASASDDARFLPLRGWDVSALPTVALGDAVVPQALALHEAHGDDSALYLRLALAESVEHVDAYALHPALLDALRASLAAVASASRASDGRELTALAWRDVQLFARGARELRVRAELSPGDDDTLEATLLLADAAGAPVLSVGRVQLARVARSEDAVAPHDASELRRIDFVPLALPSECAAVAQAILAREGSTLHWLEGDRHEALAGLHARLDAGDVPERLIVEAISARPEQRARAEQASDATCWSLALLQAFVADSRLERCELVFVTQRAVATRDGDPVHDLSWAATWGLVRAARSEHPERALRLLDVDESAASREALERAISVRGEPELALREGALCASRLVAARTSEAQQAAPDLPLSAGTVLITGGMGELGQQLAEHLVVRHGVRHLVLTSRRGLESPGATDFIARLQGRGAASVQLISCDVADRADVQRALACVPTAHPLCGVLHLAGVLDDGLLGDQSAARLRRVLAPKLDGALHLHELTRDASLACFVLFSSVAGTLGSPGQSNYAAANVFLDALAAHRRGLGLRATSIAWGVWESSGAGMTAHLGEADQARMRRQGIVPLAIERGLALFDAALAGGQAQVVAAPLDLARMQRQLGDLPPPALLRALLKPALRRATSAATQDAGGLRERIAQLPPGERAVQLVDLVRGEVALVLGLAIATVDPLRELRQLGLDSLMAVELRNRLGARTGITLPTTLAFDYPTPSAIAELLLEKLSPSVPAAPAFTREEIKTLAELLVTATPEQLAAHGLVGGLRGLGQELRTHAAAKRDKAPAGKVQSLDRRELMKFVNSKIGVQP